MPVELGGEEAGPAHLAVADDVDAGLLLVADREVDRVVEHLGEVGRPELAALRGVDARPRTTTGRACEPTTLVSSRRSCAHLRSIGSAKANARAGFVDEQSTSRTGRVDARAASIAAVNPSSSQRSRARHRRRR